MHSFLREGRSVLDLKGSAIAEQFKKGLIGRVKLMLNAQLIYYLWSVISGITNLVRLSAVVRDVRSFNPLLGFRQ